MMTKEENDIKHFHRGYRDGVADRGIDRGISLPERSMVGRKSEYIKGYTAGWRNPGDWRA